MKWFSQLRSHSADNPNRFVVYHVDNKPGFWQWLLNGLGIPTEPQPAQVLVPVKPRREPQRN